MWICIICNYKNGNSNRHCYGIKCPGKKPQDLIDKEKEIIIRDYCPKCMSHQDFKKIVKKKYKCLRCKRSFKFRGKPVPEIKTDTNVKIVGQVPIILTT